MRVVHLVIIALLLAVHLGEGADESSISYEEFTLQLGDRVDIGGFRVELVEVQSIRDGLTVLRVSQSKTGMDEQRVLVLDRANDFEGGADDDGLTITVTTIFDDISAKVRIEYPTGIGTPRKRTGDVSARTTAAPNLIVTKSFDRDKLNVGDSVKVTIAVKNVGTDVAENIQVMDQPPLAEFLYIAGYPPKIRETLDPGESDSALYVMSAVKEGIVKVPPIEVRYSDKKDNIKSNQSKESSININPARRPKIELRMDPVKPLNYSSTALLNVRITNSGQASAYRVELTSEVKPTNGLRTVGPSIGRSYFEIPPGRTENFTVMIKGEQSGNYTVKLRASFQGGEGLVMEEDAVDIVVMGQDYKYLYYLLIIPIVLIALWVLKRYREYKY